MDSRPTPDDSGVGIISTIVGFLVAMVLLLLAVQLSLDLWTRSVLSAVAYDAARIVAGSDAGATASSMQSAEAEARSELGASGRGISFRWSVTPDLVSLTVEMRRRSLLPSALTAPLGLDSIARTADVRVERVR